MAATALASLLLLGAVLGPSGSTDASPPAGRRNAADQLQQKKAHFGIGAIAGDPLGLSLKLFIRPRHALQWHLGWGPLHDDSLRASMDYVFMPKPWVSNKLMDFVGYVGVGVAVAGTDIRRDPGIGVIGRVPVLGFAFHWRTVPLDTVLEVAWAPFFHPLDLFGLDAAIAVRYYF